MGSEPGHEQRGGAARAALGIRWTIGDVRPRGYRALQLSAWGMYRAFGERARYAVCVNTLSVAAAQRLAGPMPPGVEWIPVTRADIPAFISARLDDGMAWGMGWKFAPLRVFPGLHELALDNDCILWRVPEAVHRWLSVGRPEAVMGGDVARCYAAYDSRCGPEPINAGLRGLPPGFDLAEALRRELQRGPERLTADDEQGLQVAAVSGALPLGVVPVSDVTIVSPFPPHLQVLGACGAHFVGVNTIDLGWELDGRSASEITGELWSRLEPLVAARVLAAAGEHATAAQPG